MISIVTTRSEDLEAAFDLIEGEGFWKESIHAEAHVFTLKGAVIAFNKGDISQVMPFPVYGRGGFNRYYVRSDGRIRMSGYHADKETLKAAESVGFEVD